MHITFDYSQNAYYTDIYLSNDKYRLEGAISIFDTGCEDSLLMCIPNVYQGLKQQGFIKETSELRRSIGASGSFDTKVCIIKELQIGKIKFRSLVTTIAVSDYREACTLLFGNDLINLFTSVDFNISKCVTLSTDKKIFRNVGKEQIQHMRLFG